MTATWRVLEGDCRNVLAGLDAGSVQTCVTSPPYFGLRDYGHNGQIGLEPSPEKFTAALIDVFREVRRVLRNDGTAWLNLGDGYNGRRSKLPAPNLKPKNLLGIPWMVAFALRADGWYLRSEIIWHKPNPMPESVTDRPTKAHEQVFLLAKGGKWKARVVPLANLPAERIHLGQDLRAQGPNLVAGDFGVRLATAILDRTEGKDSLGLPSLDPQVREQGDAHHRGSLVGRLPVEHWAPVLAARLLRSDIAPKEFLSELYGRGIALADRDKFLIGGIEAEFALPPGVDRYGETSIAIHHPGQIREFDLVHGRIIVSTPPTSCSYFYDADAIREEASEVGIAREGRARITPAHSPPGTQPNRRSTSGDDADWLSAGRNKRSVWTVATAPYPGAHFATFPPKLIEPCILAGCPAGGTVLDPFAGAGTTGMVALRHDRSFIGIELNPEYVRLARDRIIADSPLLNTYAEKAA